MNNLVIKTFISVNTALAFSCIKYHILKTTFTVHTSFKYMLFCPTPPHDTLDTASACTSPRHTTAEYSIFSVAFADTF